MKQTEQMRKLGRDISLLTDCMRRFWQWAALLDGDVVETVSCALCVEYFKQVSRTCGCCPIAEDGHVRCNGTPYLERTRSVPADRAGEPRGYTPRSAGGFRPTGMTCEDAAAELVYLAGLRDRLAARLRSLEKMADEAERKQASRQRAAEARQDAEAAASRVEAEAERNVAAAKATTDAATEGVRWYSLWLQGLMTREELTTKMRQAAGLSDAPKVPADAAAEDEMRIMKRRLGRLVEAFLFYVPPESGDLYNRHELVRADKEAIWRELGLTEGEMLKGGDV